MKIRLLNLILLLAINISSMISQQGSPETQLILIGGKSNETLTTFIRAAIGRSVSKEIKIVLLPIDYPIDEGAPTIQDQAKEICNSLVADNKKCSVVTIPITSVADANNPNNIKYIQHDLSGIYVLSENPLSAMQIISHSLLENSMKDAYNSGVVLAGSGAAAAMLSETMIAGYRPGYDASNALDFGSIEIWIPPHKTGLPFGLRNAIIDHHFFINKNMNRLLNAISNPNTPHIGIGLDDNAGIIIKDNTNLIKVFGKSPVVLLDTDTYNAASTVRYNPERNTLSLRNVLVHLLGPGDNAYDLISHQLSSSIPSEYLERDFQPLTLPSSAGGLYLSGNLIGSSAKDIIFTQFINQSGGEKSNILIVAHGYSSEEAAQKEIAEYQENLPNPSPVIITQLETNYRLNLPNDITGIILISQDSVVGQIDQLSPIKEAWISGIPLLTDGPATRIAGAYYKIQNLVKVNGNNNEFSNQDTEIYPGLGLVNITLEPQINTIDRWEDFFSLAYHKSDLLAFGIPEGTALELTQNGAMAIGNNAIYVLDNRLAAINRENKPNVLIANGIMDVYTPGENIRPVIADTAALPIPIETPALATNSPTLTLTITPQPAITSIPTQTQVLLQPTRSRVTRTPRPTATHPAIPPSADPGQTKTLILFAILAVIVVLIGVWINRRRLV